MRLLRLLAISVLATLSLAAQESALSGTWVQARADDVVGAINAVVADMLFLKRPIARPKLVRLNPVYKKVIIAISDKETLVKFDDRDVIPMPPGGRPGPWTREDGDKFMVAAQVSKDQMIQTFKNDEGERTNIFKLSADGKTLTMSATVKSPQLPRPLTYSISFSR